MRFARRSIGLADVEPLDLIPDDCRLCSIIFPRRVMAIDGYAFPFILGQNVANLGQCRIIVEYKYILETEQVAIISKSRLQQKPFGPSVICVGDRRPSERRKHA